MTIGLAVGLGAGIPLLLASIALYFYWLHLRYVRLVLDKVEGRGVTGELCFENHRWFDLKRTTRVVNRPITGTGNPNLGVQTNLPSSSNKWVWPIVEVEIRANPQMTQNTGY